MSTHFTDATAAIKALWAAHWPAPAGVPVFWHENVENIVPDDPETVPSWIHLHIEFEADAVRAFGGGLGQNELILMGSVTARVFTARGGGEATALQLLGQAHAAFARRRSSDGRLTCRGVATYPAPLARMDGLWWQRSALAAWEFRYQG